LNPYPPEIILTIDILNAPMPELEFGLGKAD